MSRYDDEVARRTANTQKGYEAWAAREAAKGNHDAAKRIKENSDSLGRIYGAKGTKGAGGAPQSGGCAVLIIAVAALGTAGAAALQAWSAGGFS